MIPGIARVVAAAIVPAAIVLVGVLTACGSAGSRGFHSASKTYSVHEVETSFSHHGLPLVKAQSQRLPGVTALRRGRGAQSLGYRWRGTAGPSTQHYGARARGRRKRRTGTSWSCSRPRTQARCISRLPNSTSARRPEHRSQPSARCATGRRLTFPASRNRQAPTARSPKPIAKKVHGLGDQFDPVNSCLTPLHT